ncbi:MAG: 30S ribosomal protein S6 [Ardenticatenaceae bacterium]|nr:30S ribosomal protein S6 [Anaerolineales bacterium]MCB8985138.1 30S ribosomal protein S6 [Ardenticatenaceae bacterium]MCB8986681.1 30S ribosomal protein S6 [Ardenticatenaceae bacterium]
MREYEVTVILQPNLEETPRNELVERIVGWMGNGQEDAEKPVINHWGKRFMAYDIQGFQEGYYVFFEAKMDPDQISELERNFQFTEDIIRYLVVRKEE